MLEKHQKITSQGVQKNSKGNIKNKVHACLFCEKVKPNVARHLKFSHKNEIEVAKILIHQKGNKGRRKLGGIS